MIHRCTPFVYPTSLSAHKPSQSILFGKGQAIDTSHLSPGRQLQLQELKAMYGEKVSAMLECARHMDPKDRVRYFEKTEPALQGSAVELFLDILNN